jgi:tRNA G18 (ribose-2'-O)-methylase SpoU
VWRPSPGGPYQRIPDNAFRARGEKHGSGAEFSAAATLHHRTSSGAVLMVPWAAAAPWPQALDRLRVSGFTIVAMTQDDEATGIGAFVGTAAARGKIAVLLGTEGHGLTAEALARADVRLRIPMTGALDSLNIATAAGIALHRLHEVRAFREQRRVT